MLDFLGHFPKLSNEFDFILLVFDDNAFALFKLKLKLLDKHCQVLLFRKQRGLLVLLQRINPPEILFFLLLEFLQSLEFTVVVVVPERVKPLGSFSAREKQLL